MTKLFAVGFPKEMGEIELEELFSVHALVRQITVVREQATGVSKGYAFIEMMDELGAERAIIALDGMAFGKRVMSVRVAKQRDAAPPRQTLINKDLLAAPARQPRPRRQENK